MTAHMHAWQTVQREPGLTLERCACDRWRACLELDKPIRQYIDRLVDVVIEVDADGVPRLGKPADGQLEGDDDDFEPSSEPLELADLIVEVGADGVRRLVDRW